MQKQRDYNQKHPGSLTRTMQGVCVMLLVLLCAMTAPIANVRAADLILDTTTPAPAPGDMLELQLSLDLGTDEVVGGAFDLAFDPAVLSFDNFTFDQAMDTRDSAFDTVAADASGLVSLGFGNVSGFTGVLPLGTVRFQVIGTGSAGLQLGDSVQWSGLVSLQGTAIATTVTVTAVNAALLDTDGDGIPDIYDQFPFDTDNDGFTNAEEIAAGTDPFDPLSFPVTTIPGDVTGDGIVNAADVLVCTRIMLGQAAVNYDPACDVAPRGTPLDGKITAGDIAVLQQMALGI